MREVQIVPHFGLINKIDQECLFYQFLVYQNRKILHFLFTLCSLKTYMHHQFWTCGTLIYTIYIDISCTIKFSLKPRPISLQRTKTPSNYLSDLAIHKIILAISTISIPIILAITNTPNFTSIILAISISIPKILAFPIEQKNIEEEGRGE
jgi:hypothetical protein